MHGLLKLTWLEIKIFVREPLGVLGSIVIPVLMFIILGRSMGGSRREASEAVRSFVGVTLPVFAALLIAFSAVLSLVTIISIYREGGILKRLRATPLRSHTILTAHVIVKLVQTGLTLSLLIVAGKRYLPVGVEIPVVSFTLALLLSTLAILSLGFIIASVVPTARFAQPVGALILYPMVAVSGLFMPIDSLPPMLAALAHLMPPTYAVSLMGGILLGEPWSAHFVDVLVLGLVIVISLAISARVFRWE
jgi:ABC-2 type transport system permease protein